MLLHYHDNDVIITYSPILPNCFARKAIGNGKLLTVSSSLLSHYVCRKTLAVADKLLSIFLSWSLARSSSVEAAHQMYTADLVVCKASFYSDL